MKKSILSGLMATLMFAFLSCSDGRQDSTEAAEDQNEEQLNNKENDDADFAVEAADGGLMEVEAGTLALTKASSAQVKQFAQMMVDDHAKANNELKSLAQQKNITVPTVMSNEQQRKVDNLKEKSGAEFDKEYIDMMVKAHKEDIDKFEDAAEDEQNSDPELRSWASAKLTTLRQHLQEAERIQEALKNNK